MHVCGSRRERLTQALDASVGPALTRSRAEYAAFLRGSIAAVVPLEDAIARRLGKRHPSGRARRLRADLVALGSKEAFASPVEALVLETRAAAFGAAYVMEGSALGGLQLAERVRAALGDDSPCDYLGLRGSRTGARWKWFLGELAAFDGESDETDREESISTANATFALYRSAFEQAGR